LGTPEEGQAKLGGTWSVLRQTCVLERARGRKGGTMHFCGCTKVHDALLCMRLQTEGLGEFFCLLSFRDLLPGAERRSQTGVRGAKVGRAGASEARPARATEKPGVSAREHEGEEAGGNGRLGPEGRSRASRTAAGSSARPPRPRRQGRRSRGRGRRPGARGPKVSLGSLFYESRPPPTRREGQKT